MSPPDATVPLRRVRGEIGEEPETSRNQGQRFVQFFPKETFFGPGATLGIPFPAQLGVTKSHLDAKFLPAAVLPSSKPPSLI